MLILSRVVTHQGGAVRISVPFYTNKEFKVEGGDFSNLEIRQSGRESLHYFYDVARGRLITDFILHDGPKIALLCNVTLIYKNGSYTPRLKFWKKDKTKPANEQPYLVEMPDMPETRMVKALVDTSDGHENYWRLIEFIQQFREISLPASQVHIVANESAQIASMLEGSDKAEVIEALRSVLGGKLTQADLDTIANRKGQLEIFDRYLTDGNYFEQRRNELRTAKTIARPEDVWQDFFEKNPWIFGYGLSLIACRSFDDKKLQQITAGTSIFSGAGKRSDSLLRTRGLVSSLLFCEIKRHDSPLLKEQQYREPDVYVPSNEVVGAVSQVQVTAEKAVREIGRIIHQHYEPNGMPTNIEVSAIKPRQVVVVGNTGELKSMDRINPEKASSFEIYRRSITNVEIVTFDELYERALFIVKDAK
ncbi:Shedu immune nuclease family protein [Nonomuraea sp. NPDC052116]|uniref:Shedu immune nuclease family protein n=1 Tax=Nonomuraea sp. NPDC052116 TaxID=3155665 RepID=UPI003448BEEE